MTLKAFHATNSSMLSILLRCWNCWNSHPAFWPMPSRYLFLVADACNSHMIQAAIWHFVRQAWNFLNCLCKRSHRMRCRLLFWQSAIRRCQDFVLPDMLLNVSVHRSPLQVLRWLMSRCLASHVEPPGLLQSPACAIASLLCLEPTFCNCSQTCIGPPPHSVVLLRSCRRSAKLD